MSSSISTTRAIVLIGSVGSGTIIFGFLIGIGFLFNDINNFYDEIMSDMNEFNGYANDAWKDIVYFQGKIPAGEESMPLFSEFVGRIKRQYNENPSEGINGGGSTSGGSCSMILQ